MKTGFRAMRVSSRTHQAVIVYHDDRTVIGPPGSVQRNAEGSFYILEPVDRGVMRPGHRALSLHEM